MSNYLQSLATIGTALALETAHFEDLATVPDTVKEVNTTPSAVLQALSQLGDYEKAINAAIKSVGEVVQQQMTYRGYQISPSTFIHYVCDQLMIDLVTQISWRLVLPPGRVSLYITPSDITDSTVIALAGQGLMYTAERSHLAPNKLLISVPATYAGIQAARILERGNGAVKISCNMRAVVTPIQAIACAQAGLTRISVPISAIKKWHVENGTDNPFLDLEDIKCHPGINFVKRMISIFNDHRYTTQIVAEDFSTVEEVTALAGVKEMILPKHLIEALNALPGPAVNTLARVHGIDFSRDQNSLPKRPNGQAQSDFDLDTFNQNAGPIYAALTEEFLLKTRADMDELRNIVKGVAACDPGMANWLNGHA